MRLDKYLTNKYPNLSRAYIKDQIKLGNFLVHPERSRGVGDKQVKPSYVMSENDQVVFAPGFSLPDGARILPNPNIKLNIIYEDNDVIVINKPAGLSVHPRQDKNGLPLLSEIDSTLVSGLLAHYPAIANVGDKNPPPPSLKGGNQIYSPPLGGVRGDFIPTNIRPGLVHRLDKDTSGVMIIAKNQISFDWLKKQFADRLISKKYIALVHGRLKEKQGEIKTLLGRATENPTKQKVAKTNGKEAVTRYQVSREFKDYTLLEASPKTGRLHQIRVHLAHLGHPVAGDAKYGDKRLPSPPGLIRQFLHAQELKIALPDGQEQTFSAPLPSELNNVIQALENI